MTQPAAHTRTWETGEAVFGIPFLLSLILGWIFPLPLPAWIPRFVSIAAGLSGVIAGLWLMTVTRRQFRRSGQPTDPGHATTQIITGGPFSWSRNPLYLAAVIFVAGLGALVNSLWVLAFLIPAVIAAHFVLIMPEEKYLEAKFGEPYLEYTRSVRRWIGRRSARGISAKPAYRG